MLNILSSLYFYYPGILLPTLAGPAPVTQTRLRHCSSDISHELAFLSVQLTLKIQQRLKYQCEYSESGESLTQNDIKDDGIMPFKTFCLVLNELYVLIYEI